MKYIDILTELEGSLSDPINRIFHLVEQNLLTNNTVYQGIINEMKELKIKYSFLVSLYDDYEIKDKYNKEEKVAIVIFMHLKNEQDNYRTFETYKLGM